MSGSEPRLMFGRGGESYGMALHNPSPTSSPSSGGGGGASMSSMCLAFGTDAAGVYKPIMPNSPSYHHQLTMVPCGGGDGGPAAAPPPSLEVQPGIDVNGMDNNSAEPMKRKRGRPRKYAVDGCSGAPMSSPGSGFSGAPAASPPPGKKGRGRPPGSGKKQQTEAGHGSEGVGFTPHVITVKAGEDITSQILSFTQNGTRAVCILSANGAISNVTLRQSATSGGSVTYEGRFEILSLSGSFTLSENGGQRGRTGGLSVSIAGPDGRVLGGCVAGFLIAASPVQVVIGSFIAEESKSDIQSDCFSVPPLKPVGGGAGGSPPSQVTVNELSSDPRSPINHHNHNHNQGFAAFSNRTTWQLCPPGNNI